MNNLEKLSIDEIKSGYTYDIQTQIYMCNACAKEFETGEIFKIGDRYFDAEKAVEMHVWKEHPDRLETLLSYDKKYTGITENQKELLSMIHSGMTDSEIAKKLGVAAATIRHQRFTFREKAKQAKLFLAIYELAFQSTNINRTSAGKDEIIDVHKGAKMIDDRYFISKEEEDKIIESMFSSLKPLKLKVFSSKEKKKIVILKKIAEQFDKNKRYSEKEINRIIGEIHEDFATIRRYLVEYGFMERTKDCKEYWVK